MAEFLLAISAFIAAHVIPPMPPIRAFLIGRIGRPLYFLAYSLLSLALLAWIVVAARRAPYIALWDPAPWQALVAVALMPLAFWLIVAGLAEPNPLSITLRRAGPGFVPGPIVTITRHPVLWGFMIWAAAHIPANGDVVSLILFGGMFVLALGAIPTLDRRARRQLGEHSWQALAQITSTVPFAALLRRKTTLRPDGLFAISTAVAVLAYFWFLLEGHRILIGLSPLARLSW
ncbi:MAG: NnrU family protein [Methyloceanibacter sp.]|uniref:NnrU family protein n=1 Tax=Methyloceanibacter sp. TaxID=1965321 RepID=UPI001E0AC61F|nr:NnrU family protein [Methyloceanibacter sp.]MCB1441644.1 NnrU family protein [Methyloceanibacter sp.]